MQFSLLHRRWLVNIYTATTCASLSTCLGKDKLYKPHPIIHPPPGSITARKTFKGKKTHFQAYQWDGIYELVCHYYWKLHFAFQTQALFAHTLCTQLPQITSSCVWYLEQVIVPLDKETDTIFFFYPLFSSQLLVKWQKPTNSCLSTEEANTPFGTTWGFQIFL